ncbi:DCC-interacting protein 13-alpha [Trichinella britovi]|uniref:DCC-interacting protein 13-alpha n=2 Tax=Trichinella TaxID=6333 RepID=A0A0V1D0K6_TRIBR|nr:DCC-interacting protein 13-alpha [Trichinella murrelli]KRY54986.1 DCC-interacting protein 13-alpha [Trichinella britovi]
MHSIVPSFVIAGQCISLIGVKIFNVKCYQKQTRCMLKVFEEDAKLLHEYVNQFQDQLESLVAAQKQVAQSMEKLSAFLGSYSRVCFPLALNDLEFPALLEKFQGRICELGSWMNLMVQQLRNCVLYPVNKLLSRLVELENHKEEYDELSDDLNTSLLKLVKLSPKCPAKKVEEIGTEYGLMRQRFHQAGLNYFTMLNLLQYQRRIAVVEPLLSLMYAYRSFFRMGNQCMSHDEELDDFFTRVQEQIQSFHIEQQAYGQSTQDYMKTVEEIGRLQPDIYYAEGSPLDKFTAEKNPIRHKRGYLFFKSKTALLTKWDRIYFYTENRNLVSQGRDDIASQILLEIDNTVHASFADHEERRYCFSIGCANAEFKKQFIFQAICEKDCREWIEAINYISQHGNESPYRERLSTVENTSPPTEPTPDNNSTSERAFGGKSDNSSVISFGATTTTPIQFDMLNWSDEEELPTDTTLLSSSEEEMQMMNTFEVKFLGCMEVENDRRETTAHDAIRQVLQARMVHNIIRAVDMKMLLAGKPADQLRLLHPDSGRLKARFAMVDLVYWTSHANNERVLAFTVRRRGRKEGGKNLFICYVLESTGCEAASEICDAIAESVKTALQSFPINTPS